MTENQEDALYEFLENNRDPFTIDDVVSFIRLLDSSRNNRLAEEVIAFIDSQNVAFRLGPGTWVSRRGCFEPLRFVISPTRPELLNGILIPGHRCVPFANPVLMPQEYRFFYKGNQIPFSSIEGPPEEFYPYYTIFGEEYAPEYVAKDNTDNESAFNSDPYEDPPEVSIQTLDMRNLYRELAFVPGDRFVVRTRDWRQGCFELEQVKKDAWSKGDLYAWLEAAEEGFEGSFKLLGPGRCTEEQIAYAYWYGGKRMRDVPAYSLEDFLYEQTDRIETTAYGMETRFWFAGKDIPDRKRLEKLPIQSFIEEILNRSGAPFSEYVVQSYVCDALFRRDRDIAALMKRIVPPAVVMDGRDRECLTEFVTGVMAEIEPAYSPFKDSTMGPIRQRMGELHTAVIELTARLRKGDINMSWLPKHTFIILAQIQEHAAGVLEDLDTDTPLGKDELNAIDNSLDNMIEAYEDIKELIDDALDSFRQNNLSVVKAAKTGGGLEWRILQVSLGGTDVWRRLVVPESCRLRELHGIVQALLGWKGEYGYHFALEEQGSRNLLRSVSGRLESDLTLGEIALGGGNSLLYEYGSKWTVKILLLSRYENGELQGIHCVAGAAAAPPEYIDGPMRFRRYVAALEKGADAERELAFRELGRDFDSQAFDLDACNRNLASVLIGEQ
ncbi:MAG: plasmid pRiA4b ORF-3 family protein [Treponema sp.]|jgi:hypothetical protein|nr:plasmid pRiA4b ORF-3 family protein [Treponema sp.]